MLMTPPGSLGPTPVSIWFGVLYCLFYLMNTYCNIPYDAMAPELTTHEVR